MTNDALTNSPMNALLKRCHLLSRAALLVGGLCMLGSVLIICIDVLGRKVLGMSTIGSNEISGYVLAISTSWAIAFGMLERINIRVDIMYRFLPTRIAALVDWLSTILSSVFIGYIAYYGYGVAETSWLRDAHANTSLGTPLWIPQGLWMLGLVWAFFVLMLMSVKSSTALVKGDVSSIIAISAPRSVEEEADEEAAEGQRQVYGENQ